MAKTLIIKNSNFSTNAIKNVNNTNEYVLCNGLQIDLSTPEGFPIKANEYRANVLSKRSSVSNPNTWGENSDASANLYSFIEIPTGAKTCKIRCTNNKYYFGLCVRDNNTILYDSQWIQASTSPNTFASVNLEDYPNGLYITSTLKKGSSATDPFSDETFESLGWSIEFGY